MYKRCIYCNVNFLDKTKNHNRKHCGNSQCVSKQKKLYNKSTDQIKYKANVQKFKLNNPNYLKEWRKLNGDLDRKLNREYKKNRSSIDINFKLANNLRHRLYSAISNDQKTGSAVRDLGCSVEMLKAYLEALFQKDMTWSNYGLKGWHIDHIKPLVSFDLTNEKEFKEACHYTNLQPMWATDNLKKGGK
jgi:hypothetical protein